MQYSSITETLKTEFIEIWQKMVQLGPRWVVAIAILIITWAVARLLRRTVQKIISKTSTQGHIDILISRGVSAVLIGIGVVLALSILGMSLSAALATIGLASVGIGFALQDILSNLFAGVILLLQHPFTIGDQVRVGDLEGVVENVRVRDTQILTYNGERIYIPNKVVFNGPIINYTSTQTLRVDLPIKIKHAEDIDLAKKTAKGVLRGFPGIMKQPVPVVLVKSESKEVELILRFWIDSDRNKSQRLRSDVTEAVLNELREKGIPTIHEPREAPLPKSPEDEEVKRELAPTVPMETIEDDFESD